MIVRSVVQKARLLFSRRCVTFRRFTSEPVVESQSTLSNTSNLAVSFKQINEAKILEIGNKANGIKAISGSTRKQKISRILAYSTVTIAVGYSAYAYRRHYVRDELSFVIESQNPSVLTKIMTFLHLFPSQLSEKYANYSGDLYCERLAYHLVKTNPLEWTTMEDAYDYLTTWFDLPYRHDGEKMGPLNESQLNQLLLWIHTHSSDHRLFVIGERIFNISPISFALISECLIYFEEAMMVLTHDKDVQLYLTREHVTKLFNTIQEHFHVYLSSEVYQPSFEDRLLSSKSYSFHGLNEHIYLKSSSIELFNFVDLMAIVARQVKQDNQLLLFVHSLVMEMRTKEGKVRVIEEKEEEKKKERKRKEERIRKVIEECSMEKNDDEMIDYLVNERMNVRKRWFNEMTGLKIESDLNMV